MRLWVVLGSTIGVSVAGLFFSGQILKFTPGLSEYATGAVYVMVALLGVFIGTRAADVAQSAKYGLVFGLGLSSSWAIGAILSTFLDPNPTIPGAMMVAVAVAAFLPPFVLITLASGLGLTAFGYLLRKFFFRVY